MTYIITNADGSVLTKIAPQTVDNTTSLTLNGYGSTNYGQTLNQNFLYLLQNFACAYAPQNPINGQIWYNTLNQYLQVYTPNGWLTIATASWLADQGYVTENQLNQYASVNWVEQQNYLTAAELEGYSFITVGYVNAQNFVTQDYLASQNYVTQTELNNLVDEQLKTLSSSYVSETFFAAQNFVTESYLIGQSYATETYVQNQNYASAALLENYLTENQQITITGDVVGTGNTNINLELVPSGVTPGTYTKVVVNSKGLVTAGDQITPSDITSALGFTPLTDSSFGSLLEASGYQKLPSGLIIQWVTGNLDSINTELQQTIAWNEPFPNMFIGATVSTNGADNQNNDGAYYQIIAEQTNLSHVTVQRQLSGTGNPQTTPFIIGLGF